MESKCKECSGKGYIRALEDCLRPASACCGGCYANYECGECEGTGVITINEEENE